MIMTVASLSSTPKGPFTALNKSLATGKVESIDLSLLFTTKRETST